MAEANRVHLGPPPVLVQASKAVMGAIDFDPFTTPDLNRLVCAAKIYDRNEGDLETAVTMDWDIPGEKRVFAGCAHGAEWTRKLMNKTIREYRKGNVDQAILWVSNNETLTKCPWVWEFPVCIPFRRLRPTYWCDELETHRSVSPSAWSAVVYIPPADPKGFHTKLSRFHNSFFNIGAVVFNELSGQGDWETGYRVGMKKKYDYYA